VGRDRAQWVAQCVSDLIYEPSTLHRLYNSSHNYERQWTKPIHNRSMEKNTYHTVLKWPMHWLYGAQLCHFILLIDNVIIAIGVR
jgi:hypothetical protein